MAVKIEAEHVGALTDLLITRMAEAADRSAEYAREQEGYTTRLGYARVARALNAERRFWGAVLEAALLDVVTEQEEDHG